MVDAVEVLDLASCELRGMGTDVHVLVLDGVDDDLHWAAHEVDRLEGLWSRFREDSEVTRITRGAGAFVPVSAETLELVAAAWRAWSSTGGAFDPLLGGELAALGYDRSFDDLDRSGAGRASAVDGEHRPTRRSSDLEVDVARGAIRIAPGTALDVGGIAKGWTADRLVEGLLARGAAGACANLGGDLAVGGRAPHPAGWAVDVEHLAATDPTRLLMVTAGGVATSTALRRTWVGPTGDPRHHLLDPRTGLPCAPGTVDVTVLAGSAAEAEVLSKVAFAAPERFDEALRAAGAAAIVTSGDAVTTELGDRDRLARSSWGGPGDAG